MTERFYRIGDGVYLFDRRAFAERWLRDKKLAQKIGVSRQSAYAYCAGKMSPSRDRVLVIREIIPESLVLVGDMPEEEALS